MGKIAKDKIKDLPRSPGIYKFKNKNGKILYVGKAKDLRSRVGSYFQGGIDSLSKTARLLEQVHDFEIIQTMSEFEALILEAELIKIHFPKYNIQLKDDKSYLYIVIRNSYENMNASKVNFPIVVAVRAPDIEKTDKVFGPYPDTTTARYVVKSIRRVFSYRDCSSTKFNKYKTLNNPCLYGHIGVCSAPCVGNISQVAYKKTIHKIDKVLRGESDSIVRALEKSMNEASKSQQYEEAANYRDTLNKFRYISQKFHLPDSYIDNPYLASDIRDKSLVELISAIPILQTLPERIECYDISNISGKDSVGSMVVAISGIISKKDYRKFKVGTKSTPDDFMALYEIISRRLSNNWDYPDLFVVDGGKGQVSVIQELLDDLEISIPLVGLAKKEETIVFLDKGKFVEVTLSRSNEGLKLLQRLRDEAHRFAQSYHHKLRLKSIKES